MLGQRNITISTGKGCFTRCDGCYNYFGKSVQAVSTEVIVSFLEQIKPPFIQKITLAGEDPLSRPDILQLIDSCHKLGFRIHLDTVGTNFLSAANTIFFGSDYFQKIEISKLNNKVSLLGIPLDGSSSEIMQRFRKGRKNIFEDQTKILELANEKKIPVCINTVLHSGNINDLENIFKVIQKYEVVTHWQIFQFMPIGQFGFNQRKTYSISLALFDSKIEKLKEEMTKIKSPIVLQPKSATSRKNNYLIVDSDGEAWIPKSSNNSTWNMEDENNERIVVGNIQNMADIPNIVKWISKVEQ